MDIEELKKHALVGLVVRLKKDSEYLAKATDKADKEYLNQQIEKNTKLYTEIWEDIFLKRNIF